MSVIKSLSIAGGSTPSAQWDLTNNDLIVDYTGTSPMGVPNSGSQTIARWIAQGYNAGSWNGNGIITSEAGATRALGFVEASAVGSTSFAGKSVDNTSVLVGFTYAGDFNLTGTVDLDDFTQQAAYFGTSGTWWNGDFDYNGTIDLDDFTILSANFGLSPDLVARSTDSPLEPLYIAMLDYPEIYWGAKGREDIWWRFAEFEGLNLGTVPPMPESMRGSVPEPAAGPALLGAVILFRRRRR